MTILYTVFVTILVVVATLLAAALFRNPLPRRMGLRNIRRRLGSTVMVIVGSMIGTALISGSLILYDSLEQTAIRKIEQTWGEIDLELVVEGGANLTHADCDEITKKLVPSVADGILPCLVYDTAPSKINSDGTIQWGDFGVQTYGVNIPLVNAFGSESLNFPAFDTYNSALISRQLATLMDLHPGDQIQISPYDQSILLTVQAILPEVGLGGDNRLFLPHKTLRNVISKDHMEPEANFNRVYISSNGGVISPDYLDASKSTQASALFAPKVEDLLIDGKKLMLTSGKVVHLYDDKETELKGVWIKYLAFLFLVLSCLGIFSGALLLINLFSMLAEERKVELGILRAMGLSRTDLTLTFTFEGLFYSLCAAAAGTALGSLIGLIIIKILTYITATFSLSYYHFDLSSRLAFSLTPRTLAISFSLGVLLTLFTIFLTSVKVSRLNIVEAIRGLSIIAIPRQHTRWIIINVLMVTFGTLCAFFALLANNNHTAFGIITPAVFYFSVLLAIGLFIVASLRFTSVRYGTWVVRYHATIGSGLVLLFISLRRHIDVLSVKSSLTWVWAINEAFSILGIVITLSVIIAYNLHPLSRIIGFLLSPFAKPTLIARMGMRYPSTKLFHTCMTLVMFGVVVTVMGYVNTVQSTLKVWRAPLKSTTQSEWDIKIEPERNISPETFIKLAGAVSQTPGILDYLPLYEANYEKVETKHRLENQSRSFSSKITEIMKAGDGEKDVFSGAMQFNLLPPNYIPPASLKMSYMAKRFDTSQEMWKAFHTEKDCVIMPETLYHHIPYGTKTPPYEILMPDGSRVIEVIGLIDEKVLLPEGGNFPDLHLFEAFYCTLISMHSNLATSSLFAEHTSAFKRWIRVIAKDPKDTNTVIEALKQSTKNFNLREIRSTSVDDKLQMFMVDAFSFMIQGFLALSLTVGAAGVAIVMMRSVSERRQQIGMLRSLGMGRLHIGAMFILEAALLTAMGIFIGAVGGIFGSGQTINDIIPVASTTDIELNYFSILLFCAMIFLVSMLFTVYPIIKATRLSPVEATNYPE